MADCIWCIHSKMHWFHFVFVFCRFSDLSICWLKNRQIYQLNNFALEMISNESILWFCGCCQQIFRLIVLVLSWDCCLNKKFFLFRINWHVFPSEAGALGSKGATKNSEYARNGLLMTLSLERCVIAPFKSFPHRACQQSINSTQWFRWKNAWKARKKNKIKQDYANKSIDTYFENEIKISSSNLNWYRMQTPSTRFQLVTVGEEEIKQTMTQTHAHTTISVDGIYTIFVRCIVSSISFFFVFFSFFFFLNLYPI